MSPPPPSRFDPIDQAYAARRWETARRLCHQALEEPGLQQTQINQRLRQLHDIYQRLGDFCAAGAALHRIVPESRQEIYEDALIAAIDYGYASEFSFYRTSDEMKAGHTYEVYQEKFQKKAKTQIGHALAHADTPEQIDRAKGLWDIISQLSEGYTLGPALAKESDPAPVADLASLPTGSVAGIVRFEDGSPAAGVTVTLGLKLATSFPDPATLVDGNMGGVPEVGPMQGMTTVTDVDGRYRFESVPAERHEFLAVTLDPATYDIPTRFLQHGVRVKAGVVTEADLTISEWTSAPPRQVTSPFQEEIQYAGRSYCRVRELVLKNPFYYDFPRQAISIALPPGVTANDAALLLFSSVEMDKPQSFQVSGEGVTFFTSLPQMSDRVFALYQVEGPAPASTAAPSLAMVPDPDGKTALIDTGAASFRIAYGEGNDAVPPLVAVRGADGLWRGEGRFVLPGNVSIISRKTELLESGPLVCSVAIKYMLSNQSSYTWILTTHRDEAYLLVREISPEIEGAAFDFSLREFHGGRGYLHWKPEGNDKHWTDLVSEDRELARIQESVAWWLPPQGFGYAFTPKERDRKDFIAVFSRRRGDWIDRKFTRLSQGPGENRELDWPFPEMVGSTISMITAHTDTTGDAYFHFRFFDGERQWGILVSDLEHNDGPFKELSSVQHKNSSPRLQDFKDWHLDEQDKMVRPFVVAHRSDLKKLREKKSSPLFAPQWKRVTRSCPPSGPAAALIFAIDNNPMAAWRKKVELVYAAQLRSKMILLGRDFGDAYSPVGARPVAPWAESYDLIAASGCFTADEERIVRQFLVLMGHMHMEPDLMNWKFNSRNANFEADRADLVGTVGVCFLGGTDTPKFIDHCVSLTEKSINVYCTPGSGKWYENPTCYYLHASKCRMNLLFHLHRHGLFDATQIPRLKDFLRWGAILLTPRCPNSYEVMRDGLPKDAYPTTGRVRRLPPIGDHAHVGAWVPDHYALAAQMYRESDPQLSDFFLAAFHEGGRDAGAYGNAALLFCALSEEDLRPAQFPALPSRKLEGFGAIFRDRVGSDKEFYLLFKQGPGGYRFHRTEGSIILYVDSRPLIYEGGEAGDTWRHSTLSFYDAATPLAVGHVERFHDLPGLGFVQGVHPLAIKPGDPIYLNDGANYESVPEAYARFAEPNPVDVRSILNVRDEYIVMHDDLRLSPEIPCQWHLQVVSDSHTGDAKQGYLFQGRFGVDLQVLFPGQTFHDEMVEHLPIHDYKTALEAEHDSKLEGYFFKERHATVLRPPKECFATRHLMVQAVAPKHYLAVLRPLNDGRKPVAARALSHQDRIVGLVVEGENIHDLVFLSREAFTSEIEGVRFEGRYGAVIRREGSLQLHLLAGTVLEAEGIRITSHGPAVRLEIKSDLVEMTAEGAGRVEIQGLAKPVDFELSGNRINLSLGRS